MLDIPNWYQILLVDPRGFPLRPLDAALAPDAALVAAPAADADELARMDMRKRNSTPCFGNGRHVDCIKIGVWDRTLAFLFGFEQL